MFKDLSIASNGHTRPYKLSRFDQQINVFPSIFNQDVYPTEDTPKITKTLEQKKTLVEYDSSDSENLCYRSYMNTHDVIPDYSRVGYENGDQEIPEDIPSIITLEPAVHPTDDTKRIQAAIDSFAKHPVDPHTGYRGVMLLKSGVYRVSKTVRVLQSGIVIRGESAGNTTVIATGKDRYTVFQVTGKGRPMPLSRLTAEVLQTYVPVGAVQLRISPLLARGFRVGDEIVIERRGNQEWIEEIGMNNISLYRPQRASSVINWRPFELTFTRTILAINRANGIVTIDIPLTNSIEKRWGGGRIFPYRFHGRLDHVGIEHINFISDFDANKVATDETGEEYFSDADHPEAVLSFERMIHGFARNITATHFNNFITVANYAKWVTVENCRYSSPVAPIDGGNRYAFFIDRGAELVLFKGNYAEHARHAFIVGSQLKNNMAVAPHHRWSVGGLFDNVNSDISVQNREHLGSGHGWSGANYVLWNTVGKTIVQKPPTAWNFAFGVEGEQDKGTFGKNIPQ
ncbi:hypothetical protein K493DRAFT_404108, partial [Basidiobolus meristosporus CBS 931.73]